MMIATEAVDLLGVDLQGMVDPGVGIPGVPVGIPGVDPQEGQ